MRIGSNEVPRGVAGRSLLEHSKWIAERFERMNEQLLTLSGTFIGFLVVELGLIGQIDTRKVRHNGVARGFGIAGVILLAVSVIAFFIALWSVRFQIPRLQTFQEILAFPEKDIESEPLRLMLSSDERDRNIQKSLENENIHINRYYKAGLVSGGLAQICIVTLLIVLWA